MPTPYPRILQNGEAALTIEFGEVISAEIHARVVALDQALQSDEVAGVIETLPTYRSLYVSYDPDIIEYLKLSDMLMHRLDNLPASPSKSAAQWTIPVCFEAPYGEDVRRLAETSGMTSAQLIEAFCSAELKVYMYGFAPGYAFLGKLPEPLTFARRQTPRAPIASGTLITAGGQASLATCPMPTGWHVLGRTPQQMWGDSEAARMPFLGVGDAVRFEAITNDTFNTLVRRAVSGERVVKMSTPA